MRVVGVDEAGRGCFIGPLVVAGAAFRSEDVHILGELGVRDSKQLTARRREKLYDQIMEIAVATSFFYIQPRSIDSVVTRSVKLRRLNYLEAMVMAKVIRDLEPDEAYVDASDVNAARYGESIRDVIRERPRIVSEHKADSTYLVVSAASVLAKVRRDAAVAALREEYGDFNSGYCHDVKALRWLESWFGEHEECPPFVRASWKTVSRIRQNVRGT